MLIVCGFLGGWSSEDESEPSSGSEVPSRESSAGSYKGGQSTRRLKGLSQLPPMPTPRNQYSQQLTVDIPNHGEHIINPFKPNGFFHSYYLEKSIVHFRCVRLIFSSLA